MSEDCDDRDPSVQMRSWNIDSDDDGYGTTATVEACNQPEFTATNSEDCNDEDPQISPEGIETCDDVDNDCNGTVDDDPVDDHRYYRDVDGDSFGDESVWMEACEPSIGWVEDKQDCNDSDPGIHPAAEEICGNNIDEDCSDDPTVCHLSGHLEPEDAYLRVVGETAKDGLGAAITWAGNWDGTPGEELWIGIPGLDATKSQAGAVFLQGGNETGDIDFEESTVQALWGSVHNLGLGGSVLSLSDFNGDGLSELVAGAPKKDIVSIVYSGDEDDNGGLSALFQVEMLHQNAEMGTSLAKLSDMDGDGLEELLIGSSTYSSALYNGDGSVALVLSQEWSTEGEHYLEDIATAFYISGEGGAHLGSSLSNAGDTDGDGFPEFLSGAPNYSLDSIDQGAAFLVEPSLSTGGELNASIHGQVILGNDSRDQFGSSLSGVGDTNGDGYDDLLIGVPGSDNNANNAGVAALYLGPLKNNPNYYDYAAAFSSTDEAARLGDAVAPAGDMNLDGFADIAIAAPGALSSNGHSAGAVYFFLGPLRVNLAAGSADATVSGNYEGQELGSVLGGPGYYDDDDRPDFVFSAMDGGGVDQHQAADRGAVYVFLGIGI